MHAHLQPLLDWYMHSLQSWGYVGIILLMAIESSVFPLPSEAVIPPAAILAHTQGGMTLWGIVLAGAFGCWIGASIMYWVSRTLGRAFVMKYGRYVLISPQGIEKAERWSAHFGSFGIFTSRLILVVRHLIGIPAGIVRFNYLKFSAYTLLGSALWCSILCWIAVKASEDTALMHGELKAVRLWSGGALLAMAGVYYFFVYRYTRKQA